MPFIPEPPMKQKEFRWERPSVNADFYRGLAYGVLFSAALWLGIFAVIWMVASR